MRIRVDDPEYKFLRIIVDNKYNKTIETKKHIYHFEVENKHLLIRKTKIGNVLIFTERSVTLYRADANILKARLYENNSLL